VNQNQTRIYEEAIRDAADLLRKNSELQEELKILYNHRIFLASLVIRLVAVVLIQEFWVCT